MSNERGGKPAFPQHVLNPAPETYSVASNNGMTFREWYAGMALQGLLAATRDQPGIEAALYMASDQGPADAAREAFRFADAMIQESARPKEPTKTLYAADANAAHEAVWGAYHALKRAAEELGGTGYFRCAADKLRDAFSLDTPAASGVQ